VEGRCDSIETEDFSSMLTLFAFPKPFAGRIDTIQRNAIKSWQALRPRCDIFLFGNDPGVAEVAKEYGVRHVAEVAHNELGTPLLSDVFKQGTQLSTSPLNCYVNGDIILTEDFLRAVERVRSTFKNFLLVGECIDLNVLELLDFDDPGWQTGLRAAVRQSGTRRGPLAMDYFVFPRNLYGIIPDFALGRARFDNWLVWRARDLKVPVVDATAGMLAVHQNHDYSHVAGGMHYTRYGQEAVRNRELAGGSKRFYTLHDATHRLTERGLERNVGSYCRVRYRWEMFRERMSPLMWQAVEFTRPVRHMLGFRVDTLKRFKTHLFPRQ
jgi:hypothetical protein